MENGRAKVPSSVARELSRKYPRQHMKRAKSSVRARENAEALGMVSEREHTGVSHDPVGNTDRPSHAKFGNYAKRAAKEESPRILHDVERSDVLVREDTLSPPGFEKQRRSAYRSQT